MLKSNVCPAVDFAAGLGLPVDLFWHCFVLLRWQEFTESLVIRWSVELYFWGTAGFAIYHTCSTVTFLFSVPIYLSSLVFNLPMKRSAKPSGQNGHEIHSHMQLCLFWELILILYKFQIFHSLFYCLRIMTWTAHCMSWMIYMIIFAYKNKANP